MTRATCPSDLALESYLLEPDRSPLAGHLDDCPGCASRLARMQAEGEDFRRFVFPATVDAVQDAAAKRRFSFRWPAILAPVGALAAVAVAVLVAVGPSGPDSDYVGMKGGVALAVYVNGSDGAKAVADREGVPASAALRFSVKPARDARGAAEPCWLWIVSVDAKGAVSRLYPPEGASPEPLAAGAIPGGALLDGEPGPERIYAVCARDASTGFADVKVAAEAAAGGGAERVRAAGALGGALAQVPQATLLLEKKP